jgi:hypothetical protein
VFQRILESAITFPVTTLSSETLVPAPEKLMPPIAGDHVAADRRVLDVGLSWIPPSTLR